MKDFYYYDYPCYAMVMANDNSLLAIGSRKSIFLIDLINDRERFKIVLNNDPDMICFSENREWLITTINQGEIRVYSCLTGELLAKDRLFNNRISFLFYLPNRNSILGISENGEIGLYEWQKESKRILLNLTSLVPWSRKDKTMKDFECFFAEISHSMVLDLDREESKKEFFMPYCNIVSAYMENQILSLYDGERTFYWKYPFEKNKYIIERSVVEGSKLYICPANFNIAAIQHEGLEVVLKIYNMDGTFVFCMPKLKRITKEDLFANRGFIESYNREAITWAPNGEYLAVTIVESDLKTDMEKQTLKIYQSKDWTIVKEYILPGIHFVGFSRDSKYLLLGTSLGGYCIEIADFLS